MAQSAKWRSERAPGSENLARLALRYFDSCNTWLQIPTWTSGHYCTMEKVNCPTGTSYSATDSLDGRASTLLYSPAADMQFCAGHSFERRSERSGVLPRLCNTSKPLFGGEVRNATRQARGTIRGDQLGANLSPAGSIANIRIDSRGPLAQQAATLPISGAHGSHVHHLQSCSPVFLAAARATPETRIWEARRSRIHQESIRSLRSFLHWEQHDLPRRNNYRHDASASNGHRESPIPRLPILRYDGTGHRILGRRSGSANQSHYHHVSEPNGCMTQR